IGNGDKGYSPREAEYIMTWAAVGQPAVFFMNDEGSETCIGTYWYQCHREDEWWELQHAEPYLLRSYCGDTDDLARAVTEILAGKEVIVPCLANLNKQRLRLRRGKLQHLKASLTRLEYDADRDLVNYADDGLDLHEYKTFTLLAESAP